MSGAFDAHTAMVPVGPWQLPVTSHGLAIYNVIRTPNPAGSFQGLDGSFVHVGKKSGAAIREYKNQNAYGWVYVPDNLAVTRVQDTDPLLLDLYHDWKWSVGDASPEPFDAPLAKMIVGLLSQHYKFILKGDLYWMLDSFGHVEDIVSRAMNEPTWFKSNVVDIIRACAPEAKGDCGQCTKRPPSNKARCMSVCTGSKKRCKRQASDLPAWNRQTPEQLQAVATSWRFCQQHQDMYESLPIRTGQLPPSVRDYLMTLFQQHNIIHKVPPTLVQGDFAWEWIPMIMKATDDQMAKQGASLLVDADAQVDDDGSASIMSLIFAHAPWKLYQDVLDENRKPQHMLATTVQPFDPAAFSQADLMALQTLLVQQQQQQRKRR
jgi:hypothetical protein